MPSKPPTAKKPVRKSQPRRHARPAAKPPASVAALIEQPVVEQQPANTALFDPPVPPPSPAPATAVETAASNDATAPTPETAAAVQVGDMKAEEPLVASATVAEEPTPSQPALAQEVVTEPVPERPVSAPNVDMSDEPRTVRLGGATALLLRMPLGEVLIHADAFASKLAALAESKSVLDLQPRMAATEGRCAPIYFTGDPDDGEPEHLLSGDDALSAAIVLGLDTVSVIIVAPGDAGLVQSHLSSYELNKPVVDPEEDFLRRVLAYQDAEPPASPAP